MSHKSPFARMASIVAAAFATAATAQNAPAQSASELEEVVVTGSRLQASGFNTPTPVTMIDAQAIAQRAPANIADAIYEAPSFFVVTRSDTTRQNLTLGGLPQGAQNTLNLRALGDTRTLTLINGRRVVATNWTGTVDTNIVPVGLVERIDIVTGGASAAYGSDAVAGVANIILRNKMQGVTANAQVGMSQYQSAKQYTASLAGGTAFADNRANVVFGIDYNKSDPIKSSYGKGWGANEIGTVSPTAAQRAALGLPASYIAGNVEPGTSAPGGLYQQSAGVNGAGGVAYTFDASGNPVLFNQGIVVGSSMIGSTSNYGYNTSNAYWLRAGTSRLDLYGRLSFDVSERLTAFVEASYAHDNTAPYKQIDFILGAGFNPGALTISRTNPYVTPAILGLIPATATTFSLGRIMTEIGGSFVYQSSDVRRVVAGLDGKFGKGWKWEVSGQSGRTRLDHHVTTINVQALQKAVNGCTDTTTGLTAAQRTAIATYEGLSGRSCVGFNPFGVGRNAPSALDYFVYPGHQLEWIIQDSGAASLSGPLFAVPAGDVSVAAGIEARREHIDAGTDPVSGFGSLLNQNTTGFAGGSHVKEGFAEAGIPLLKDAPFARSLNLNGAARRTDYELSGQVTTSKFGFTWEPFDSLRVRYTRSRDIRAPNFFETFLVGGVGSGQSVINRIPGGVVGRNGTVNVNPLGIVNTVAQPISFIGGSGGGSSLRPEIAHTTTGGLVYQQAGFRTSLDYYKVEIQGALATPGMQAVVDLCRDGIVAQCQNIIFDSTVPGGISLLETKSANLNRVTIHGYDLEVAYRRPMLFGIGGNLSLRTLINYAPENKTFDPLTGITTERAGSLTAPKLAATVTLGWNNERVNANVQFRGFGERRGNALLFNSPNTVLGPEDAGYNVANGNTVNRNRYAGRIYVNPSVDVKINDAISAFANVDNLFDAGPPPLTANNLYDLIGRRFRVGVRARL